MTNYDELGVGKDWHNCDYSRFRDHVVQLIEKVDYYDNITKRNAHDDNDDQYSHLKTSDTKHL